MAPYLFPYPTTGSVTFANVFIDRWQDYSTELADATIARTRFQLALKAAAGNEPGSSALAVLEAVQVYLPYLRGIIACVETDDLLYKGAPDPTFPWKSGLTNYSATVPTLPLPSIYSELHFVVVAYCAALSNYAHYILASLPSFESSSAGIPALTSEDEKKTTAALTRAVDLLSQAAGVADWAAANVTPKTEEARADTGGRLGRNKWPVEAGPEAFRGLSMIFLADAHVTAIRKLLLPILGHQLFAPPGPPLPSHHPSPSLLGKLYLHVASLYTSAAALFSIHLQGQGKRKLFSRHSASTTETDAADADVIPELARYLRKEGLLSSALASKWLGVDAGESKGNTGDAMGWITDARSRLTELEDSKVSEKMKGLSIGRAADRRKEARKTRQGRVEREIADVDAWMHTYKKMNDMVSFQSIPSASTLVTPPGRPILTAKAFSPPDPRFAPVQRDADGDGVRVEGATSPREAEYAGKGNYF